MKQHIIKSALLLLLLYAPALFAEPPAITNGGDSSLEKPSPEGEGVKAVEVLRDPTVISEKMEQSLKNLTSPTLKNALTPPGGSTSDSKITDPTRMNQSFRDALNRKASKVGNGVGPAVAAAALPKITLLASICGAQKNSNSAMLGINGKTEMVRAGDKFSIIENSRVMEVEVMDIHPHYVKVMVLPFNETLILR